MNRKRHSPHAEAARLMETHGRAGSAHRLALAARKVAYGRDLVASGPVCEAFEAAPNGQVRVRFGGAGDGIAIGQSPRYAAGVEPNPKDKLIGFFIVGEDRKWVDVDARIDGGMVLVCSAGVATPVAVRYGWANSPRCNFYNREGLPAPPFRTDDWP